MNIRQILSIIAEETGCPSFIRGIHPQFSYCCDKDRRGKDGCYCENAAIRIVRQHESILQPTGSDK